MNPISLNLLNIHVPDASGLGFNTLDFSAAADWVVPLLVQGSLAMLLAMLLVRLLRPQNLLLRRLTCVVVLMHGWMFAPWKIEIPWHDPPAAIAESDPIAVLPNTFLSTASSRTVAAVGVEAAAPVSQSIQSLDPWRSVRLGILAIWSIGIFVIVSVQIHGYRSLIRASRRWREAPEAWARTWTRLWKTHRGSNGFAFPRRAVPMRVSLDHGPMLCRLPGQTCLVVPEAFWSSCDEAERAAVLKHELSHWRHRDIEKTWAVGLFALPYWFHPAAWWSLAEFRQAAELRCDTEAASTADERSSFLRALGKLVDNRNTTPWLAGHSAHAHPLLVRMRRLTEGPLNEETKMKKWFMAMSIIALLAVQTVRPELVAQEAPQPMSVEAVEAKMRELDRKLESLAEIEELTATHAEKLRQTVDAKAASLEELRNAPEKLSAEAHRRAAVFLGGDEADQLKSLDGIVEHKPIDEAVLFCGQVAQRSEFESVRREALRAACSLGKTGYPAIAIAYKDLNTADKVFLLQQIRPFATEDRAVLMALMAKDAGEPLLSKLIAEPFADDRRLVLLGKLADEFGDDAITEIVATARATEGQQGLVMLYAIAKSDEPEYVLSALKAARERGPSAYAVIAAAGKCEDPAVRAEMVRAARAWGGEVGQRIIEKAVADSNESLRQAAVAVMAE